MFFDEKGMLTDRARGYLFWLTISVIVVLAIIVVITIVRACSNVVSQVSPAITISPGEVDVCVGEQRQFTIDGGAEVTWEATGGSVTQSGLFTAGDVPGDYAVSVAGRGSREEAAAIVHVIACTPTAVPVLPTPTVPATPTPETIAPAPVDPQGDTGSYDTGAPVEGIPVGIDLSAASLGPEGQAALQPTGGVPAGLDGWVAEGEMLLWVTLYEAIPSPPAAYMSWLFALDIDGSMATGRPPGSRRINPDLGDEAVLGVSYDPNTGTYDSYFYAWDSAQGGWVTRSEGVRYIIDDSRTIVAFALPLDAFTQAVTETSGVTLVTEAVKGRAAAESYVGDQRVIDFYPDVP